MRLGQRKAGGLLGADHRQEIALHLFGRGMSQHVADPRRTAQVAQHMRRQRTFGRGNVQLEGTLVDDSQTLPAERLWQVDAIQP
ncbi:hypothetical protein D3C86_2094640 [compost metagenome]